jgi:excisionase family DNA binding protein
MSSPSLVTPDLEALDPASLAQLLGEAELLRARVLRKLDPHPVPTPAPQPAPAREASALTIKQAAERLQVSASWVRRRLEQLGAFRIGSRNWRIPESAVVRVEKGGA